MRRKLEAPNLGSLKPLFFPNHIPTQTLTSLKYRFPNPDPGEKTKEVLKVASENLFERCVRRNYFFLENRISNGCAKAARSSDRQLVENPGSSKALISLNYNPYPNHNFAKIPLPKSWPAGSDPRVGDGLA